MTDSQEKCTIILGTNGTGKSTIVAKMIVDFIKKGGRALIITPDDQEWPQIEYIEPEAKALNSFTGIRKTVFFKETLPAVKDYYKNGMLIFDDCRAYLKASVELELHYILIRRRQNHTNLIFVAHGFTDVIPKLFTFSNYILLFKTLDNITSRKDTIKDFRKMEAAVIRVNAFAESNPHYFEIIKQ